MSSSEARKEQAIVKARELEARRSATLEKDAMKLRAIDAAVRIQAGARRRLAQKTRAELFAIARAPKVIQAERFEVWQMERRKCFQPGYAVSMLSLKKCEQERRRYPWVRNKRGISSP